MVRNEAYSSKDFTHQSLVNVDPAELNNTEIFNSCFYREVPLGTKGDPRQDVFPAGMTGVRFYRCNLDNCKILPGNTVEKCSQRLVCVQNDMEDWIVDAAGKAVEPVCKKRFSKLGLSQLPKDLPAEPRPDGESVVVATEIAKIEAADAAAKAAFDGVMNG